MYIDNIFSKSSRISEADDLKGVMEGSNCSPVTGCILEYIACPSFGYEELIDPLLCH